jgi:hypothetical protein
MVTAGSVKPNAFDGDFHDLLGERPDIEGARSPRLVLCLFKKAMAAARNRESGEGEARSGAFGLTTPAPADRGLSRRLRPALRFDDHQSSPTSLLGGSFGFND